MRRSETAGGEGRGGGERWVSEGEGEGSKRQMEMRECTRKEGGACFILSFLLLSTEVVAPSL